MLRYTCIKFIPIFRIIRAFNSCLHDFPLVSVQMSTSKERAGKVQYLVKPVCDSVDVSSGSKVS